MNQEIEIPEGHEAKIVGNKVVFEQKESEDEKNWRAVLEYIKDDALRSWLDKLNEQKPFSQEAFNAAKHEALWEEQQPAEWSEEDEAMLKEIISFFKDGSFKLQHDLDLYAGFLEKRLKSLRPQPKHENMIELFYPSPGTAIHDAIEEAVEKVNTSGEKVVLEFNDWHRIIKPGDNKQTLEEEFWARHRKWKPSKEQIKELFCAIDCFEEKGVDSSSLHSLLDDLKKL